jgi:hypothetical protein
VFPINYDITETDLMKYNDNCCVICLNTCFNDNKATEDIAIIYSDLCHPSAVYYPSHHLCLTQYILHKNTKRIECPFKYIINFDDCAKLFNYEYYLLNTNKQISVGSVFYGQGGAQTTYSSKSGDMNLSASILGTGELSYKDIRNQGPASPRTFNLRDVTGSVFVSHKISEGLSGFARGTVTARQKELGMQSRQEIGVNFKILDKNGELVIGHEGKIMGPTIAFVPGSLERNFVDFSLRDSRDNKISGGVFCSTQGRKDCRVRIKGVVNFGVKKKS